MTKEELEQKLDEKLNAELSGKEYDSYNIDYAVLKVIRSFLNSPVGDKLWSTKDGNSNVVRITYNRSTIAEITVKKIKGKKHYNCIGSYTDWTIGKITTVMLYDSFAVGMAKVDDYENEQKQAERQCKIDTAKRAKEIMKALNITDTYELFNLAERLKGYRYNDEFAKLLQTV